MNNSKTYGFLDTSCQKCIDRLNEETMDPLKTRDQFDAFAEDLLAERAPRPLIIVGASKVDVMLLEVVRKFLLPKAAKANDQDELLEGDRPLTTFSSRIKICFRLGLIDTSMYKALEDLRDLRNKSAHAIKFDISKSPIRERLTELLNNIGKRNSYRLTKNRYFDGTPDSKIEELQCSLLTLCVLLEAIREKIRTTRGEKSTLKIASR